jgi:hypothetical protein
MAFSFLGLSLSKFLPRLTVHIGKIFDLTVKHSALFSQFSQMNIPKEAWKNQCVAAALSSKFNQKPAAGRGAASDGLGLETVGQSARLPTEPQHMYAQFVPSMREFIDTLCLTPGP